MEKNEENPSVLIVDDEESICLLVSRILSKKGYKVQSTYTLGGARAILEKSQPDIVFLDLNLPDGTGFDLIPEIDEESTIVICSAYSGEEEKKEASKHNVKYFIEKPLSVSKITEAIDKVH